MKKTLIIMAAALFFFALTSSSRAAEKNVKTAQPAVRAAVKETIKPAQDTTKEEIKTGVPGNDADESEGDSEEEEEDE